MIIENKVTKFLSKLERCNDNLIYLADIEVEIVKITNVKKGKVKKTRSEMLKDELFEINPGEQNKNFLVNYINKKCNIKETETMVIKKVILKEEHGCSVYKR